MMSTPPGWLVIAGASFGSGALAAWLTGSNGSESAAAGATAAMCFLPAGGEAEPIPAPGPEPAAPPAFSNCFVAGTPVTMADGSTKPIEQVKAGDHVQSRPQEDAANQSEQGDVNKTKVRTQTAKVARTFVHEQAIILKLHLESGETITTTPGHPFAVEGKGFISAGRLAIGNAIVTRAGPPVKVVGIEHPVETATVYNFEVEGTHTYFVGNTNGGLWVHNQSQLLLPRGPSPQLQHIFPQKWRPWFSARGIDIDQYTVSMTQRSHLSGLHGVGGLPFPNGEAGIMPGRWNARWADFISNNPNATAHEVYQFGGQLMDEYGLSGLPIVPYR
jgi:hypothetical protein